MGGGRSKALGIFTIIIAAIIGVVAYLPQHAWGEPIVFSAGKIVVSGVKPGDQVAMVNPITTVIDDQTNAKSYESDWDDYYPIPTIPASSTTLDTPAMRYWISMVNFGIRESGEWEDLNPRPVLTVPEGQTSVTFNDVYPGYYYFVVSPGDKSLGTVYQRSGVEVKAIEKPNSNPKFVTDPVTNITLKSKTITPAKKAGGQEQLKTMGVAESIPYTISTVYPIFSENFNDDRTFIVSDTLPSGLSLTGDVTVKASSGEDDTVTLTEGTHYTINKTTSGFTITFSDTSDPGEYGDDGHTFTPSDDWPMFAYEGYNITISYNATFQNLASLASANKLTNTAQITYTADNQGFWFTEDWDYNTMSNRTVSSTATVNYHNLTITKTDAANAATKLKATFKLYKKNTSGASSITSDTGSTVNVDDLNLTYTTDATTGQATIIGLSEGTYYLVETVSPVGYVVPQNAFKVEVTSASANNMTQTITNVKNPILPTTGGAGTIVLSAAGLMLLLLALLLLARRRKREKTISY